MRRSSECQVSQSASASVKLRQRSSAQLHSISGDAANSLTSNWPFERWLHVFEFCDIRRVRSAVTLVRLKRRGNSGGIPAVGSPQRRAIGKCSLMEHCARARPAMHL